MNLSGTIFDAVVLYATVGVVTALAFVSFGIGQVLQPPLPATLGARILLLPGSFALWPYILIRWHRARRRR
jgi:hypothetical protein